MKAHEPRIFRTAFARFVAIQAAGVPDGSLFLSDIQALHAVADALKRAGRRIPQGAYGRLHAVWHVGSHLETLALGQPEKWTLMMRVVDNLRETQLSDALADAAAVLSPECAAQLKAVKLISVDAHTCIESMHRGPYGSEAPTAQKIERFARERGLVLQGDLHAVYLSNPDYVPPEHVRTLVRMPVLNPL